MRRIRDFLRDDRGGTLIEYGLILALIFIVMMVGINALAVQAVGKLNNVSHAVVNAGNT